LDYEKKVREVYLKLAKKEGFLVFDGEKEIEKLSEEIFSEVLKRLRKMGLMAK